MFGFLDMCWSNIRILSKDGIDQQNQIYILDLRRALEAIDSGKPLAEIANSNVKERSRDPEPVPAPVPEPEPEVSAS